MLSIEGQQVVSDNQYTGKSLHSWMKIQDDGKAYELQTLTKYPYFYPKLSPVVISSKPSLLANLRQ
jgi:hypothetical protein